MRKYLIFLSLLVFGPLRPAAADSGPSLFMDFKTVKVYVPFSEVGAVYLFDCVAKRSLVGAETPLAAWKRLEITGGAVTSLEGKGSPFLGAKLSFSNPVANFVPLNGIQPGIFAGRDFNNNAWVVGFKATMSIFQ